MGLVGWERERRTREHVMGSCDVAIVTLGYSHLLHSLMLMCCVQLVSEAEAHLRRVAA